MVTLIIVCIPSFSQNIKLGVFIDPQLSWLYPDAKNVEKEAMDFGLNGGLMINRYFQKNYALYSGISIGTQGGSLQYDDEVLLQVYDEVDTLPAGSTVNYKLKYITIPLGLKLKTNQIGYFTYFAQVGFSGKINISARADVASENIKNDNILKSIKFFNAGYFFGGGIEYSISSETSLMLGLIYTNGFLDITENPYKITTRDLAIRLGIMF